MNENLDPLFFLGGNKKKHISAISRRALRMAQGAAASRRAAEASQTTLASVRQVMRSTLVRWGDGGVAFYGKDLFYFRKSYNRIIAKLQIFDKR